MNALISVGLVFFSAVSFSQSIGLLPDTIIEPVDITTETNIRIGADTTQGPCYSTNPFASGEEYYLDIDENNNVSFAIPVIITTPCAKIEGAYEFFEIGTLPEGNYQFQYNFVSTRVDFPPSNSDFLPFGDLLTFDVVSAGPIAEPVTVPVLNGFSLFLIIFIFLGVTFMNYRKKIKIF